MSIAAIYSENGLELASDSSPSASLLPFPQQAAGISDSARNNIHSPLQPLSVHFSSDIEVVFEALRNTLSSTSDSSSSSSSSPSISSLLSFLASCISSLNLSRSSLESEYRCVSEVNERLKLDLRESNDRLHDVREQLSQSEKKLWESEMRRRQVESESAAKEKALKAEICAEKQKSLMIQRRDNQYKHEMRKQELQFEKIQDKLHRIILDKTTNSTFGTGQGSGSTHQSREAMKMLAGGNAAHAGSWEVNNQQNSVRGKGANATKELIQKNGEIELLQSTLRTYTDRMAELLGENAKLRKTFSKLDEEIQGQIGELQAQGQRQPTQPGNLLKITI